MRGKQIQSDSAIVIISTSSTVSFALGSISLCLLQLGLSRLMSTQSELQPLVQPLQPLESLQSLQLEHELARRFVRR